MNHDKGYSMNFQQCLVWAIKRKYMDSARISRLFENWEKFTSLSYYVRCRNDDIHQTFKSFDYGRVIEFWVELIWWNLKWFGNWVGKFTISQMIWIFKSFQIDSNHLFYKNFKNVTVKIFILENQNTEVYRGFFWG